MNKEYEKITNLKEMLLKSVERYANKILYKLGDKEITYKDMQNKVNSLGTSLIQMGLKDKNIAIISENRYEWEIAYFAITCGTGVVVPLDKSLTKTEITTILKRANVEAIFCSQNYEDVLVEVKKDLEELKYIISFDCIENRANVMSFNELTKKGEELVNSGNNDFINAKIDNDAVGFIMFTSGTTEKSKAVMLSHKNICSNMMNVSQIFPINSTDIALSVLPLNHVLEGLFCLLLTIYKGATRMYCYDLKEIVEDINKYKISFMGAVPAIYEYIYKKIDEINKENIHIFMSGGASLEHRIEEMFKNKGINLVQGYGITETAPVISMSNNEIHKIGSVGKIIPNVELKIINRDEDGIGEIIVKGENVFLEYYQDTESTEQVLQDGWFHTGDLGKIDEDGYVFLVGRIKNMIVLPTGKKIFPEEMENIINKINGVKESFVFDKINEENKVSICAEIVCKNLEQKDEILKQIKELNKSLPIHKKISIIYITKEEIYKTSTGKMKRKQELEKIKLYSHKENKISTENSDNQDEISKIVKEILSKQLGIEIDEIRENANIVDLGIDSLDKVEIILAIEKKFNIKISKEESAEMKLVRDIIKFLKR